MVYHIKEYDLKITFTHLDHKNPEVVVTLGSEARTFQLEGSGRIYQFLAGHA